MTGCLQMLREEFRVKKFGFGDVHPERCHMFQWRVPPLVYLLYRFTLAIYVDVRIVITFSTGADLNFPGGESISWPAFLSNWTYAVQAIYLTTHFIASSVHYFCLKCHKIEFLRRPPLEEHQNMFQDIYSGSSGTPDAGYEPVRDFETGDEASMKKLPWYLKIVWILFTVVSSSALMVTLAFLCPQLKGVDAIMSRDNILLHMLNPVIVFIEHLVSGIPIRLIHVIYPIMYWLVYMFFSLFYWIADHERTIYPNILDWNQAGVTVGWIVLITFVVIPLLHMLFFIIYRIKLAIYRKFG